MSKQIADFQDTIAELEAKIEVLTREKYWATRKCSELEDRIDRMKAAGDALYFDLGISLDWGWRSATEGL
jgi:hypothetical protein